MKNRVELDQWSTNMLHELRKGVTRATGLRHLSLKIVASAWRRGCAEHPVDVQLRLLSAFDLSNLHFLEFSIFFHTDFWNDQSLMDGFKKSVDRVGKALLSGNVVRRLESVFLTRSLKSQWHLTYSRDKVLKHDERLEVLRAEKGRR